MLKCLFAQVCDYVPTVDVHGCARVYICSPTCTYIYICACVLVCTRLVGRNRLIPPELRHC